MKKIAFLAIVLVLVLIIAVPVAAKKPDECTTIKDGTLVDSTGAPLVLGYDQWGYNYQAHMFNGLYENNARPDPPVTESDTQLQMKWNDAWLSNKSCDGDNLLDRHYGYDSYIGSGAWLTNHQWGSYLGNWDVTGDWILQFDYLGSLYIHDMTVDNTFTGTGGYPSGSDPYSITWTVTGAVDGDNIGMTIDYDNSPYYVDASGTIAQDGTISGTWSNPSQSGIWESTSGVAAGETLKWNYFVKIIAVPSDAKQADGIWYTADDVEIGPVIWGAFAVLQRVYNDQGTGEHGIEYLSPAGPGLGKWK